jgi:hypothetical protein
MAKPTKITSTTNGQGVSASRRAPSSTSARPLTSRPLDLLYVVFFIVSTFMHPHFDIPLTTPHQVHIPITIFCDLQIPQWPIFSFFPEVIRSFPKQGLTIIGDPFIAAMFGYNGDMKMWTWFETFLWSELLQLVVFFIGARGLIKGERSFACFVSCQAVHEGYDENDFVQISMSTESTHRLTTHSQPIDSPKIYPLILLYASAVTMTVVPCLATILRTPVSSIPAIETLSPGGILAQWTITPEQKMVLVPTYLVWLVLPLVMTVDMAVRLGGIVNRLEKVEKKGKSQ